MPLDKTRILNRLEQMFHLKRNWDGFDTPPICRKAYDVACQMINFIETDVEMKVLVGVEPEESVYADIRKPGDTHFRIELTVLPDGLIEYAEIKGIETVSRGGLVLSYEAINDILR